jgi:hypothetical protein
MLARGEELPAQREWREWQEGIPQSGVLRPSPPPDDDDGPTLGRPIPEPDRCGCGEIIVPRIVRGRVLPGGATCRRCEGPPQYDPPAGRQAKITTLKARMAEAQAVIELEKAA